MIGRRTWAHGHLPVNQFKAYAGRILAHLKKLLRRHLCRTDRRHGKLLQENYNMASESRRQLCRIFSGVASPHFLLPYRLRLWPPKPLPNAPVPSTSSSSRAAMATTSKHSPSSSRATTTFTSPNIR